MMYAHNISSFKRNTLVKLVAICVLVIMVLAAGIGNATALSGGDFSAGNIISDDVFYNKGSMSATQIQSFLNAKVPTCDTNGQQSKSYYYNAATGEINNSSSGSWVTTTRAVYGQRYNAYHNVTYASAPYICLKDYTQSVPTTTNTGASWCTGSMAGGTLTAAQIIYGVSQMCGVNPQVLLVLLQKEQGLVVDSWPWGLQYRSATGYGCPDTAPCDSQYYGFFNQVYQAAQAYRRYRANPTNYNYQAGRNNTILYNPNTGCGSSSVYIQTQATAGLYIYTPYRPNQAALNNLYGTGDGCSSYGNRNFWRDFTDWFGSTQSLPIISQLQDRYNALGGLSSYLGKPYTLGGCGIPGDGCYQNFVNGNIYWTSGTGAWDISGAIGDKWVQLGAERSYLGYPTASEVRGLKNGGSYQTFQVGRLYWSSATGAWDISGAIGDKWATLGAEQSIFGYPTASETHGLKDSGSYQTFQVGRFYWSSTTGANPVAGGIGDYWLKAGGENSALGYPTSGEQVDGQGQTYQNFENGTVYWTAAKGAWGVLSQLQGRYNALGGPSGYLGKPYTLGGCGIPGDGCYQNFVNGNIYWTSGTGAWDISGAIGDKWVQLGAERGYLGYPMASETHGLKNGGSYQTFQVGYIYWSRATNAWDISGAIGDRWIALGGDQSLFGYPTGGEVHGLKNGGSYQKFQIGRFYWSSTTGANPVAGGIGDYWLKAGGENSALGYPTSGEQVDGQGQTYQNFENGTVYWTAAKGAWQP